MGWEDRPQNDLWCVEWDVKITTFYRYDM